MKKAQILSAIALAFALGVVAPVASTYAVCADVTVRTETKATKQEGVNAVAYVKRNATYNKIAKVAAAIREYYGTNGTDSANGVNPTLNTDASDLKGAMNDLNAIAGISSTYNSGETDLGKLVDYAVATTNYSLFANLVHDVAAADSATNRQNIIDDIRALNNAKDTDGNAVATVDLATFSDTTAKATLTAAARGIANYNDYKTLIDFVDNVKNYAIAYDAIAPAIAAAVTTTAGKNLSDANKKYTTEIADLVLEADNENITGYTDWKAVYDEVVNVEKDINEADRYTAILALAGAWKTALPDTECTAAVIAEQMMGTPAPNNPEQPGTTTPADPTTPGTSEDDPSAPGTGIVSTAEGNAATTVSIVAGLATALTALGAGVVAYRSARRSNK